MYNPNIYIELQKPFTVVVIDDDKTHVHSFKSGSEAETKAVELARSSLVYCYFDHYKNSMIYL